MKKFFAVFVAIVMVATLSVSTLSASASVALDNGTVTVNSRWNDQSIKQVTISGWDYKDNNGIEFSGTFKVTYPKGYTKNTPTAIEAWALFEKSMKYVNGNYDITYSFNGNGFGNFIYNGYNYVPVGDRNGDYVCDGPDVYRYVGYWSGTVQQPQQTIAQQEAVSQMQAVRQSAEGDGWAVEWWPSKSVAATATKAWYACEASQLAGDNISTYRFSVLTEKVGNGWKTSFKTFQQGKEYSSQTPLEVTNMLAKTTATKALQANIVRATNAQSAVSSYIQYLESRGYMTTVISPGTSDTLVNLTWYSINKGYDVRITPEARGDGTYRIHVADLAGTHTYTLKEILTFSFN